MDANNGLKELVLPESFDRDIYGQLPSTLQRLSILNTEFDKTLQDLPESLISFECHSDNVILDLSSHKSIRELDVFGKTVITYPTNLESLYLRDDDQEELEFSFNQEQIKKLCLHYYLLSELKLTNLKYYLAKYHNNEMKLPPSVEILDFSKDSGFDHNYITPNVKEIHLQLTEASLYHLSKPNEQKIVKRIYNQLPMVDNFFKLWRNVVIKSKILESFYDLIRTDLRYNIEDETLVHGDRFKNYNIVVCNENELEHLLKFRPERVHIHYTCSKIEKQLSTLIPKSTKHLIIDSYYPKIDYPQWITHLTLKKWGDIEASQLPPSVTKLTLLNNPFGELEGKIPPTVTYLALYSLKANPGEGIPASVTHLTLIDRPINTIDHNGLPDTIKRIKFTKLSLDRDSTNYEISSFISSRLENGRFYIYSSSQHKTNIPTDTTHLFWADEQLIENGNNVDIPTSVHTLVLNHTFNSPILSLPPSITQMIFNGVFKQPFNAVSFPPYLKYLTFNGITTRINGGDLPNGLTHLTAYEYFRFSQLPESLHHLEMHTSCNDVFPPQIKHIKVPRVSLRVPQTVQSILTNDPRCNFFGDFKKPNDLGRVEFNPDTILHLYSGKNFNCYIKPNSLLNNIKTIRFGSNYNQPIVKGTIPNSVEYLEFGNKDQIISKEILHTSLKSLTISSFNQELFNILPDSITELVLNMQYNPFLLFKKDDDILPNLKKLVCYYFPSVLNYLPTTICDLEFFIEPKDEKEESLKKKNKYSRKQPDLFPIELINPNITRLVLCEGMFIKNPNLIPPTIKCLTLCQYVEKGIIPSTLESLTLLNDFNDPLYTILPKIKY